MDITAIIEAIVSYGVIPVALAVLFVLVLKGNKHNQDVQNSILQMQQKMQEDSESRMQAQEKRLTTLVEGIMKGINNIGVHSREEEDDTRRVGEFIDMQLNCLIQEEKANRAYIFSYHNGGKDVTGRNFQKMSITYEAVDSNTKSIMRDYQNVPRSLFPTLYKILASQDVYYIENLKEIHDSDPLSYQLFESHGVKCAFLQALKSVEGDIIGFIVMEYIGAECADSDKAKRALEKKVWRISGALVNREE